MYTIKLLVEGVVEVVDVVEAGAAVEEEAVVVVVVAEVAAEAKHFNYSLPASMGCLRICFSCTTNLASYVLWISPIFCSRIIYCFI